MSWPLASLAVIALAVAFGFAWYERSHPSAKVLSLVAALAALATVGRIAFAAFPNVKPTTDIALLTGYTLGPAPGFAVGAVAALVSNFFFGQGPWTPWQMAAWGLTGAAGGALALVAGRNLGRVPLACACGAAGLVFGAIMDFFTLMQAGGPSLSRYAAISATSLPFNLAHAAGNVVFCLLVGPSFTRMLSRYRRRFEVRWVATAGAASALVLACGLALAPPAGASALGSGVSYLRSAQNTDGGFGAAPGQPSSQLVTGWAVLGLRAAGVDPGSVTHGGHSPLDYMRSHPATDLGGLERTALALEAVGATPGSLVGDVVRQRAGDGSFGGTINLTAFGALVTAASHSGGVDASASWLERHQGGDGGFGFAAGASSDIDDTGAAIEALTAAGRRGDAAERRAVSYLRGAQSSDGGFPQQPGSGSNAQSTAWAIQGLVAAGVDPHSLAHDPLAYIESLQRRDGSVRYSASSAQTPVWVTAQALAGLAQAPFPLGFTPPSPSHASAGAVTHARPARGASRKAKARARHRRKANRGGPNVAGLTSLPATATTHRTAMRAHAGGGFPWLWLSVGLACVAALAAWRLRRRRTALR